jgi:hypothetical protein
MLEEFVNLRVITIALLVIATIIVIIGGLRNSKRVSFLTIFVLLIPAGALTYFEYDWRKTQTEIGISTVAKITGDKKSGFACQRLSSAFFDVWIKERFFDAGPDMVGLKNQECSNVMSYYKTTPKKNPTVEQVKSVHLLATESVKLANPELNEHDAKCLGLANLPIVVEGLGGGPKAQKYFYALFVQEVQPKDKDLRYDKCN